MKRILSLLLCLVMVLSFAAPAAQASGNNDIYVSDGNLDDIIVGDNVTLDNVVINGDAVTMPAEAPELAEPTEPVTSPVFAETETTVPAEIENLVPTGEASVTFEGATVNADRIPKGGSVSVENVNVDAKPIVEEIAEEVNSDSFTELFTWDISVQDANGEDWQPKGTVQMELELPEKLHKYSKVYVVHIDDNGEESIIPASVTEDGKLTFETTGFSTFAGFTVDFAYEGAEFSINGKDSITLSALMDELKMPLDVEDVAGVEFTDYNLIEIQHLEEDWNLVSLKAFDTEETLTITMTDGAIYKVSVTDDGVAGFYVLYEDGTYGGQINNYYGDLAGGDGVITMLLDSDGCPQIYGDSTNSWITDERRFIVTGSGTLYIELQHADIYGTGRTTSSVNNLIWDLMQIRVTGGATLVIRLGGFFEGDETITLRYKKNDNGGFGAVFPMFDVDNGNLFIRCSDYTAAPSGQIASDKYSNFGSEKADWSDNGNSYIPLYIDGQNFATNIQPDKSKDHPLILLRSTSGTARSCIIEDVHFKNAKYRAIRCYANEMEKFMVKDCVFDNTVMVYYNGSENGGAAINIEANQLWQGETATRTDITDFIVDHCKFDGVSGNDDGGVIENNGRIANTEIKNCLFKDIYTRQMGSDGVTEYGSHGGAIALKNYMGTVLFDNVEFNNCVVQQYGGAVYFESTANSSNNWSKFNEVTFRNCTFTDCISRMKHGGAICVKAQVHTLKVLGCKFEGCKSLANGAAISINSKEFATFSAWQETFTGYGSNNTLKYTWTEGGKPYSTVNTFLIDDYNGTQTQFLNCKASTSGGAIEVAQNTYITDADINDTLIQGCKAVNNGSAVFLSSPIVKSLDFFNVTVKECGYIKALPATGAAGELSNHGYRVDANGQYIDAPDNPNAIYIPANDAAGTIRSTGATTAVLTMTNCTVTDNYSYSNGGGLYWNACDKRDVLNECSATVTNCTFARNVSDNYGGGIYCESKLTIQGCQIYDNYAKYYGGGIAQQVYSNAGRLLQTGEQTNMTITSYTDKNNAVIETNIYNNYSDGYGGGISIRANPTESIRLPAQSQSIVKHAVIFNLNGANIYNNTAATNGGGVSFLDVRDVIGYVDRDDAGNMADWTDAENIRYNNAEVDSYTKSITITNGVIYGNRAGVKQDWSNNKTETLNSGNGGGVYMSSSKNTTLKINSGHIYNNSAQKGNGGGIYMTGKEATCTITGGTIGGIDGTTKLSNHAIRADSVGGDGGGIAISGGSKIEMKLAEGETEGGTISYNVADHDGGGVWLDEDKNSSGGNTITIDVGSITYNTAGSCGGGVSMKYHSTANLNGGTVSYNTAASNGGGLEVYYYAYLTVSGGTISYNTATNGNGGGVSAHYYGNTQIKEGSTITRNKAPNGAGGGIFIHMYNMTVSGGEISYNEAKNGGGVCSVSKSTDNYLTTISGGTIKNNTASKYGGGLYNQGSKVTVNGGSIISNTASENGGGIYSESSGITTIGALNGKTGSINNNTAKNTGGGIYASVAVVNINGGSVNDNIAEAGWGGGIYAINNGASITMTGGSVNNNSADKGYGGGINVEQGATFSLSGGNINGNTAANGGGIHSYNNSTVTVSGGTISNNTATGNGGGIYLRVSSTATISGTEDGSVVGKVTKNTASNGGGVCVATGADLTVRNGFVTYNNAVGMPTSLETAYKEHANLAGTGGAIYVADGNSAADRSTFTLEGTIVAIYGNLADFAADDVFSNSNNTKLNVPQVEDMDLTEYSFKPEAWFEDYPTNDKKYTLGMNLGKDDGITNGKVYRYRGASSGYRFQLSEAVVTNTVNVEDTYICMTLGIPAAIDDTVVVDWGLPVQINVIDNDVMLTLDEIKQTGVLSSVAPDVENIEKIFQVNDIIYGGLDENWTDGTVTLNNLTHGTANLDKTTGLVNYRMYTTDMTMDTEDTFYYAVYHKTPNPEEGDAPGYYYYAKVQVIPATTIYFEDNFGAVKYEGPWNTLGSSDPSNLANAQDQDRVGESDDPLLDADSLYGYDSLYSGEAGHSLGSCKSIQVSENVTGTATFTFTGTGFDIISHSNNNTGMIMVSIYEGDKVDDSKLAATLMVDTFYGCTTECYKVTYTYKNGTWVRTDERITPDKMGKTEPQPKNPTEDQTYVAYTAKLIPVTDGSADTLWQVPVIKADMNGITKANGTAYGYGTYTVEIYVAWAWWVEQGRPNYESCNFYLDAIRIYDPANNGVNSDTIRDAYLADKECWPTYQELRNMFITQERLSDKPTSGIVFMDGTSSYSVNAYQYFGPNNEVYLAPNQSIAFKLDELNYINKEFTCEGFTEVEVAAVHIGMRTLTIADTAAGTGKVSISVPESGTGYSNSKSYELGSHDMYYDISHGKNKVVTIKNTGTTIIAITTAKVTHTGNSGGTDYADASELFTVDTTTALTALAMLYNKTEAPTLSPKYPTLSFEGEVFYNVYFAAEDLGSLTAANLGLVTFNSKDTEGTVDTAADVIYGAQTSGNLYVVSTNGIAAKNLGDDLYFKVFAQLEDGSYVYSDIYSYSAAQYAAGVLADSNATDSQKALVVAMLNYGAAAQTFFGHNTDALMNSALTAEQQALVSGFSAADLNAVGTVDAAKVGSFAANGGFTRKYPTVSFEGAFSINYYFVPENAVDGDMTFYYWTEDTYNTATELTAENADGVTAMTLVDGAYTAVSPELAAKELDKTIYVAATYESNGVTYSSGVLAYSLAAYCQQHAADPASNMQAFATAAAIYGCAAKEFFAV